MPMYRWHCDVCDQTVDLIQKHDEQAPPTEEESKPCAKGPGADEATAGVHTWRKLIGAPRTVRGPSWNGSKGNW